MNAGRNGLSKREEEIAKLLDGMIYTTIKKQISTVLTAKNGTKYKQSPETVGEALERWDSFIEEKTSRKIILYCRFFTNGKN